MEPSPPQKIGHFSPFWYRCYYPHRLRDSVSPVCEIFGFCFTTPAKFHGGVLTLVTNLIGYNLVCVGGQAVEV